MLPTWSAVFSYVLYHLLVVSCRLLSVDFLSVVSVSGKFVLSVVGCCLLIAVTRLLGAVVCGSFWFLVVSCRLLDVDC